QRLGYGPAKALGRAGVDHQHVLCRLLHRQHLRASALQDAVDEVSGPPHQRDVVEAEGEEAAGLGELRVLADDGEFRLKSDAYDPLVMSEENRLNEQGFPALAPEVFEDRRLDPSRPLDEARAEPDALAVGRALQLALIRLRVGIHGGAEETESAEAALHL